MFQIFPILVSMAMATLHMRPESDRPSVTYRQKLTWKITEEDWNKPNHWNLELGTAIPGTFNGRKHGGVVSLDWHYR